MDGQNCFDFCYSLGISIFEKYNYFQNYLPKNKKKFKGAFDLVIIMIIVYLQYYNYNYEPLFMFNNHMT